MTTPSTAPPTPDSASALLSAILAEREDSDSDIESCSVKPDDHWRDGDNRIRDFWNHNRIWNCYIQPSEAGSAFES